MAKINDEVNDINSPVQTNETEQTEEPHQSRTVDAGEKSDESSTSVAASFSCDECGQTFTSRQDLKEHTREH